MRVVQTTSGLPVIVSSYEEELINKYSDKTSISKIDPFELEVLMSLYSKELVDINTKDNTCVSINPEKLWRI